MNKISLFDIETTLQQLIQIQDESETEEELKAAQDAIDVWTRAEVQKVDGVRQYRRMLQAIQHEAGEEASRQMARKNAAAAALARMDDIIIEVAAVSGKTKFDGNTGYLRVQGNGGLQRLTTDDKNLTDQFLNVEVTLPLIIWNDLLSCTGGAVRDVLRSADQTLEVVPANKRIREALEAGEPVVGAILEPRGKQVRM